MSEMNLDDVYEEEVAEPEVETVEAETEETETVEATEEKTEAEPEESTTDSKEASGLLTGLMDEREKRQAAVKERDEWKAKFEATEQPKDDVSVFEDEKGYTEQQEQRVDQKVAEAVLKVTRGYAVRDFGEEKVALVEKWYAEEGMKSPHAIDRVHKSDLKFHEAVNLYDEEQARLDPDAYKAKIRAEVEAEYAAKPSEDEPKTITPSLASKSSKGTATEADQSFEDMLNP
jgi:hypothetical protein